MAAGDSSSISRWTEVEPGLCVAAAVTGDERACLVRWWRALVADPERLPPEVGVVQERIMRRVGMGRLPDGAAFLKVMDFPFVRHKVRYVFRKTPAEHEARMIGRVDALAIPGVVVPKVLATGSRRMLGWLPQVSLLVTRGLPVVTPIQRVPFDVCARVAAALCSGGIVHPDLHADNFVTLPAGGVGLLDLQSARQTSAPVVGRARRAIAGKLLLERPPGLCLDEALEVLRASGLADAADVCALRSADTRERLADWRRIVRRCASNRSEFRVDRGLLTTSFSRRAPLDTRAGQRAEIVVGGRWLWRAWLGDRVRVGYGHAPMADSLVLRRCGRSELRLRVPTGRRVSDALVMLLRSARCGPPPLARFRSDRTPMDA